MQFKIGMYLNLFSIFVFSCSQSLSADLSEPVCPDWASEDRLILERSYIENPIFGRLELYGPRLDTNSYHWYRGAWFEMPFGYRNAWIRRRDAEKIIDLEAYTNFLENNPYKGFDPENGEYNSRLDGSFAKASANFAFWMPSLRFVERNLSSTHGFQPCEMGRPWPKKNEFITKFRIIWPFKEGSEKTRFTKLFRLAPEQLKDNGHLYWQNDPDFEHNLSGAISGKKNYYIYEDDGDLAVMFTCAFSNSDRRPSYSLCMGHVWERSSNLVLHMSFPFEQGQIDNEKRWREPTLAAIKLSKEWYKPNFK